jgi:hypothetical protein
MQNIKLMQNRRILQSQNRNKIKNKNSKELIYHQVTNAVSLDTLS